MERSNTVSARMKLLYLLASLGLYKLVSCTAPLQVSNLNVPLIISFASVPRRYGVSVSSNRNEPSVLNERHANLAILQLLCDSKTYGKPSLAEAQSALADRTLPFVVNDGDEERQRELAGPRIFGEPSMLDPPFSALSNAGLLDLVQLPVAYRIGV